MYVCGVTPSLVHGVGTPLPDLEVGFELLIDAQGGLLALGTELLRDAQTNEPVGE
jgi:hypothetical protein